MSDPAGWHALLEALADPDARVRMHVTDGLGYSRVRSSDQAAALLLALADPLAHIRVAAAGALSRLGRRDARVLDALRAAAQRDDARAVRRAARAAHDRLTRP
jgi:hypothetical protein